MRAFVLTGFDASPALDDLPPPTPSAGEVLVRAHASSVNGADVAIAGGVLKEMIPHEFPVTLGRDFMGVVEQVGDDAGRHAVGDEVFGFVLHANPNVHDGSWAELIVVPEDHAASAPRAVDMAQAGAAPLAAITAVAAFDALAPAEATTVLVIGAAGGVGSFFVQLASNAGAHVVAPGLAEDTEHLRGLGAAEVPDRETDLESAIRERHSDGVDAVLDLVSFTPPDWLLRPGGRLASTLGAAGEGQGRANLMAESTTEKLQRIAELLDNGTLRVPIQATYELAEAGEALTAFSSAHTQDKLGIAVS
jgi:NADPH:quinone reductase